MGQIANQISDQVNRLEDSTISLSRFIGAIVQSLGGSVTIEKEDIEKVMKTTNWYLDVQDTNGGKITFVFVETPAELSPEAEMLLS